MNIYERVELMGQITGQRIDNLITAINKDAGNIRALVRIAEAHERGIEHIEGR